MRLEELEIKLKEIQTYKCLEYSGFKITDPALFIESHLAILKANPKKKRFLPYYNRLLHFYEMNK